MYQSFFLLTASFQFLVNHATPLTRRSNDCQLKPTADPGFLRFRQLATDETSCNLYPQCQYTGTPKNRCFVKPGVDLSYEQLCLGQAEQQCTGLHQFCVYSESAEESLNGLTCIPRSGKGAHASQCAQYYNDEARCERSKHCEVGPPANQGGACFALPTAGAEGEFCSLNQNNAGGCRTYSDFCEWATCFDGIANGNEEGVDCGSACQKVCETCSDGIKNQDETGVDCGGSSCQECPLDWVLGAEGQSCDEVCTAVSGSCTLAPMRDINTVVELEFVASLVGVDCNGRIEGDTYEEDPSLYDGDECYFNTAGTTNCDGTDSLSARICCCGNNCPVNAI
eukprot:Awhi_evm2s638